MAHDWLIWGCCAHCEVAESLEEALRYAYALDEGDHHIFHCVECPDGTLIRESDQAFCNYAAQRKAKDKQNREKWAAEHPKPDRVGVLCLRHPLVKRAWDRQAYFDADQLDVDAAEMTRRFGAERVAVLTGEDMNDWRKP